MDDELVRNSQTKQKRLLAGILFCLVLFLFLLRNPTSILLLLAAAGLLNLLVGELRFAKWLQQQNKQTNMEMHCGFFSKFTFAFFSNTIRLASHKQLSSADVPLLADFDNSEFVLQSFLAKRNEKKSLFRNLLSFSMPLLALQAMYSLLSASLILAPPFLLRQILSFAQQPDSIDAQTAAIYAILLFLSLAIRGLADGQMYFLGRRIGMRIRSILILLIFKKSLRRIRQTNMNSLIPSAPDSSIENSENANADQDLDQTNSQKNIPDNSSQIPIEDSSDPKTNSDSNFQPKKSESLLNTGKVVNLMSIDAVKVLESSAYVMYLWMTPIQVAICTTFLVQITGVSGLAGTIIMALMVPISAHLGHRVASAQKTLLSATDSRIAAISNLLNAIHIVKYFAWEKTFLKSITQIRSTELNQLWDYSLLSVCARISWAATPMLVSLITFFSMSAVFGMPLDASTVFTTLSVFYLLKMPLTTLPDIVVKIIEACVCLKRIEAFLDEQEIPDPPCLTENDQEDVVEEDSSQPLLNQLANQQTNFVHDQLLVDQTNPDLQNSILITADAAFSWYPPSTSSPSIRLDGTPIQFPRGGLTVIIGPTGSGKTSLIMSILGELYTVSGQIYHANHHKIPKIASRPSIAYASQYPFLRNTSVRNNIVFGSRFDVVKYTETVRMCGLIHDLVGFRDGDSTCVGENGVGLSGGQKQRVGLSRSVYRALIQSDAQDGDGVVVMDDPVCALDTKTAMHVVRECVCGPFMRSITRIVVVNTGGVCVDKVDMVVHVENGIARVISKREVVEDFCEVGGNSCESDLDSGRDRSDSNLVHVTPIKTVEQAEQILKMISKRPQSEIRSEPFTNTSTSNNQADKDDDDPHHEARARGSISLKVYWTYIKSCGGILYLLSVTIVFGLSQIMNVVTDVWLKLWADAYQPHGNADPQTPPDVDVWFYIKGYGLLGLAAISMFFMKMIVVSVGMIRASRHMHNNLMTTLLAVPIRFFNATPTGTVLNRCTRDIKDIDQEVGIWCGEVVGNLLSVLASLCVMLIVTPVTVCVMVPVLCVYAWIGVLYSRCSRDMKRLDSVTRSPIYSYVGECITGAVTIRSYGSDIVDECVKECCRRVDEHHKMFWGVWLCNRWLGVRVDACGALISFGAAASVIYNVVTSNAYSGSHIFSESNAFAGNGGLSLTYALGFSESVLWLIRIYALMEMSIVSVERVDEYIRMQSEDDEILDYERVKRAACFDAGQGDSETDRLVVTVDQSNEEDEEDVVVPDNWPMHGEVVVEDLCVRYSPTTQRILHNLSFTLPPGTKLAILGRTGSGKTTLTHAFFRFVLMETGSIVIDGVDISRMSVRRLRKGVTVIPQVPCVMEGTIRSNVDPENMYTDSDIWNALKRSWFVDSVVQSPVKTDMNGDHELVKWVLDMHVPAGGTTLSQGQRQLLCLARAILHSTRLIIMDEATSSIDPVTDSRIHRVIYDEFRDCTVMMVVHRVWSIVECDLVMGMKDGRIVEIGTPSDVVGRVGGVVWGLCNESGDRDAIVDKIRQVEQHKQMCRIGSAQSCDGERISDLKVYDS